MSDLKLGIVEVASSVDAEALLAACYVYYCFVPEGATEGSHGTNPAKFEIASYLLLPFAGKTGMPPPDPFQVAQSMNAIDNFFRDQVTPFVEGPNGPEVPKLTEVEQLIREIQVDAKIVRGDAYPHQTKEMITELQEKFGKALTPKLDKRRSSAGESISRRS